jgi:glycogen(starch) synthase
VRVLILTNLYPPDHIGGYELRCREVVERLRRRGHRVHVLAGRHRNRRSRHSEPGVTRSLHLSWGPPYPPEDLSSMLRCECSDRRVLADLLARFAPEVVDVWGMEFASQALVVEILRSGVPVHLTLEDAWLLDATARDPLCSVAHVADALRVACPSSVRRLCCVGTSRPDVGQARVSFVSQGLRDYYHAGGFHHPHTRVRLAGIDTAVYRQLDPATAPPPFRLVSVGQIAANRGQEDLLAALERLACGPRLPWPLQVELVGGSHPRYVAELHTRADQLVADGIDVHFAGAVPAGSVPALYARSHLLVYTSRRAEEALPRVLMEAMAGGVAIVATDTGGQREILDRGRWGNLIPPGSPDALAQAIGQAVRDWPNWRQRARAAREHALRQFDLEAYVDDHAEHLLGIAAAAERAIPGARQAGLPSPAEIDAWGDTLAEVALRAAPRLDVSASPDEAWRLATVLKRTGRLDVAEGLFEQLHDAHADDPTQVRRASFHLAEIALVRESWERAVDWLGTCLDVAPDHRKAAHNLAAIEQRRLPQHLEGLKDVARTSRV